MIQILNENYALEFIVNKELKLIKETREYSIYKNRNITVKILTNFEGVFKRGVLC